MPSAAKRRQDDVRSRFEWWDTRPTLHLMVYPTRDGLKLSLMYAWSDGTARVHQKTLLEATWAPREVTEAKIVSWAERGLAHYLAQDLSDLTDPSDR